MAKVSGRPRIWAQAGSGSANATGVKPHVVTRWTAVVDFLEAAGPTQTMRRAGTGGPPGASRRAGRGLTDGIRHPEGVSRLRQNQAAVRLTRVDDHRRGSPGAPDPMSAGVHRGQRGLVGSQRIRIRGHAEGVGGDRLVERAGQDTRAARRWAALGRGVVLPGPASAGTRHSVSGAIASAMEACARAGATGRSPGGASTGPRSTGASPARAGHGVGAGPTDCAHAPGGGERPRSALPDRVDGKGCERRVAGD